MLSGDSSSDRGESGDAGGDCSGIGTRRADVALCLPIRRADRRPITIVSSISQMSRLQRNN